MSMETDRIEADLDQSRAKLSDTLDELKHKLSPTEMMDQAMSAAQNKAMEWTGAASRQVRENPLLTAFILTGLAWFFLERSQQSRQARFNADDWRNEQHFRSLERARWSTPRLQDETDDAYQSRLHNAHAAALQMSPTEGEGADAFRTRVSQAVSRVERAADTARRRISQTFSSAKQFAQHQGEQVAERARALGGDAARYYDDRPLMVGAIALGAGAALGGLTPLSNMERRSLRPVANRAAAMSAQLAERGASLAERGARLLDNPPDQVH